MGARTAITVADLEKLAPPPEHEGKAWELSEGELILVGNAILLQERVKARVARLLTEYTLQKPIGEEMVETGVVLAESTYRIPDVLFVSNEALESASLDAFPSFVPELVIEIISDSEKPSNVESKLRQYLDRGVKEVWQVYPALRAVSISTAASHRRLYSDDSLATALLPGFQNQVAALFP